MSDTRRVPAANIFRGMFPKREGLVVHFKRSRSSAIDAYSGHDGELVIDIDRKQLRYMDGVTPGGYVVASVIVDDQWAARGFDVLTQSSAR